MHYLLIPITILCAVLTFGIGFAWHEGRRAEYGLDMDKRGSYAFAAIPALLALVPIVGLFSLLMSFVMSDFARYGVRFK